MKHSSLHSACFINDHLWRWIDGSFTLTVLVMTTKPLILRECFIEFSPPHSLREVINPLSLPIAFEYLRTKESDTRRQVICIPRHAPFALSFPSVFQYPSASAVWLYFLDCHQFHAIAFFAKLLASRLPQWLMRHLTFVPTPISFFWGPDGFGNRCIHKDAHVAFTMSLHPRSIHSFHSSYLRIFVLSIVLDSHLSSRYFTSLIRK